MRLYPKNFKHFNVVLVIPDNFIKHHARNLCDTLMFKMKFKSIFVHVESVMATYSMAVQTGCVVDIGATTVSVCCIDDGQIIPRTLIKKNYGSEDISKLMLRLMRSKRSYHYFP